MLHATRTRRLPATLLVILVFPARIADADPPPPGLTLPSRALNVAITVELDASADKVAKPLSIAPDIGYGVTGDLTLSLVHSKFALTGFRAVAGGGVCLSGSDAGCVAVYNNVGAEASYSLARGALAVAGVAGLHAVDLDGSLLATKLGAKARYTAGKFALTTLPSVLVAITHRTDAMGARLNKDVLYVPVQATYRIARPLVLGIGTGIKGPISGFGDAWQIPVGVTSVYAFDAKLAVGASWFFGQLFGGATNPPEPAPAVTGLDLRGIQLWVNYAI